MPIGYIRTGLVATLAVMFGIVQLLCACLDMPEASAFTSQSHSIDQMDVAASTHHSVKMDDDQTTPETEHGDHDHQADCSHCDDSAVATITSDSLPSVLTTYSADTTVYSNAAPLTRSNMAATNLAGLRWLDPPRRLSSPDPVTLHTRSLI